MVHTYEVWVDVKEFVDQATSDYQHGTKRYEIEAESTQKADGIAFKQAKRDHPYGTEYGVRVTRLLR